MNENLDLTSILQGCPEGTKFYSAVFGEVSLEKIDTSDEYPIKLLAYNKSRIPSSFYCTKDGRWFSTYDGECTLFPSKDQRDWNKFERFWNKPKKERFDSKTLQPFDKVLARDSEEEMWYCDFFSHTVDKIPFKIQCIWNRYRWCIPYNNETKHLVGTTNDCLDYYKWWEE